MIILKATTESLKVTTSSTADIDFSVNWVDITTTSMTPSSTEGKITTATNTTIAAPPAASTQRQIKSLYIRNIHASASNTVTVYKDISGTTYKLSADVAMIAGSTLTLTVDGEWIYTTAGGLASSSVSANPSTSIGLTTVNGTATSFMRSDAAPALSVAIVPKWRDVHTFEVGLHSPFGGMGMHQNLLTWSEKLGYGNWSLPVGGITLVEEALLSPDLLVNAYSLAITNVTNLLRQAVTLTNSGTYTLSFWAKMSSSTGDVTVDLGDGTTGQVLGITTTWTRYSITLVAGADDWLDFTFENGKTYYMWGVQLEEGFAMGPYVRTVSSGYAIGVKSSGITGSMFQQPAIGISAAIQGLVLSNNTRATNALEQYSPVFELSGNGWKTDATAGSQQAGYTFQAQTIQGAASPTAVLRIRNRKNGGAPLEGISLWDIAGACSVLSMDGNGGNYVDFNTAGIAAPAFTTRSLGTKLILYKELDAGGTKVDYAIGNEAWNTWYSIPGTYTAATPWGYKWYAGITNIATLRGDGLLSVINNTNTSSYTISEPDKIEIIGSTALAFYTDDLNCVVLNGAGGAPTYTITLSNALFLMSPTNAATDGWVKYLSGTEQKLNHTSLLASATNSSSIIQGGYIYTCVVKTSATTAAEIWRCLLTSDISNIANWTKLTISGTALGVTAADQLIGYGDGKFWVLKGSGIVPYTLSGTTLTSSTTVTITGSEYINSRVNNTGIYASFAAVPRIRFANFAGTLDGTKQINGTSLATTRFALPNSYYISPGTTSLSLVRVRF